MKDYRGTKNALGIRNNNPGNIRPSTKYTWNGAVGENKGFVVFENIHYGIRALIMDLINKQRRGLNTVKEIVNTYAPPSENNTVAYINAVAKHLGRDMESKIPLTSHNIMLLVEAIIAHENGKSGSRLITTDDLDTALGMIPEDMKQLL